MDHEMFADFLKRHGLEQLQFAQMIGLDKVTVWRWTLPPENKNRRAVPALLRAFCLAYDLMPARLRAIFVARLRDVK